MRRSKWAGPIVLALVVGLIVGGTVWLTHGGGSSGRPDLLHLAAKSSGAAAPAAAENGYGGAGGFVLVGTLPDGQPDDQPVWRLRTATEADAQKVATALHIDAAVVRAHGGWAVRVPTDGTPDVLMVRDDGTWSYGVDCMPERPVSEEDASIGCAVATVGTATAEPAGSGGTDGSTGSGSSSTGSGGAGTNPAGTATKPASGDSGSEPSAKPGSPTAGPPIEPATPEPLPPDSTTPEPRPTDTGTTPEPVPTDIVTPEPVPTTPGPSADEAKALAGPYLDRLGVTDPDVTTFDGGAGTTTVQAAPRVDGTPTVGWMTTLEFNLDSALVSGSGWLPDPSRGDSYPVITAQAAFALLKATPRAMPDICLLRRDGKPGCADFPPIEITGATLGLELGYDGGDPVLVPSWLFDAKGQDVPIGQVAIDPSYLAPPPEPTLTPVPKTPMTGEPVPPPETVEPVPPSTVEPGSAEPGSAGPGSAGSGSAVPGSSGSGGAGSG